MSAELTSSSNTKRDVGGSWLFTCIWKVKNFSHSPRKQSEYLESPSFVADSCRKTKWCLLLYPRGVEEDKHIGCTLTRQTSNEGPLHVKIDFEVSVIGADGGPYIAFEDKNVWFEVDSDRGVSTFISRYDVFARKSFFLPQDILTIRCRMNLSDYDESLRNLFDPRICLILTQIAVDKRTFTWIIKDFSTLGVHQGASSVVESNLTKKVSTNLLVSDDGFQIEFCVIDNNIRSFSSCRISVLDAQGQVLESVRDEHLFEELLGEQFWYFPELVKKSKLMEMKSQYVPNDVLTLRCEYTTSIGYITTQIEEHDLHTDDEDFHTLYDRFENVQLSDSSNTLRNDLISLYQEKKFCDVTLRTKNKAFPVHKAVLCSRSPVFYAMFDRDMKEKSSDNVNLLEFDDDTVDQMISFMYTDMVEDLQWDTAYKLYFAADMYEIMPLKSACSSFLQCNLNNINVCSVLVLGDLHQDEDLKMAAQEYIFSCGGEVVQSVYWKSLETSHPLLTNEVLRWMYLKKLDN